MAKKVKVTIPSKSVFTFNSFKISFCIQFLQNQFLRSILFLDQFSRSILFLNQNQFAFNIRISSRSFSNQAHMQFFQFRFMNLVQLHSCIDSEININ